MTADEDGGSARYRRATRRDVFVATMESIEPRRAPCEVVVPDHRVAGNGRPAVCHGAAAPLAIQLSRYLIKPATQPVAPER